MHCSSTFIALLIVTTELLLLRFHSMIWIYNQPCVATAKQYIVIKILCFALELLNSLGRSAFYDCKHHKVARSRLSSYLDQSRPTTWTSDPECTYLLSIILFPDPLLVESTFSSPLIGLTKNNLYKSL